MINLRISVLQEFAAFRSGIDGVGMRIRSAPAVDRPAKAYHLAACMRYRHKVDRQIRAARQDPPEIEPLPRVACPECGLEFGSEHGLSRHKKAKHS